MEQKEEQLEEDKKRRKAEISQGELRVSKPDGKVHFPQNMTESQKRMFEIRLSLYGWSTASVDFYQ